MRRLRDLDSYALAIKMATAASIAGIALAALLSIAACTPEVTLPPTAGPAAPAGQPPKSYPPPAPPNEVPPLGTIPAGTAVPTLEAYPKPGEPGFVASPAPPTAPQPYPSP